MIVAPVAGMLAASAAAWLAAVGVFGREVGRDVALGLAAPLAAVVVSWALLVRAHRRDPAGVTGVLLQGFVGKVIFFGVYVVAVWTQARPDPVPFIASFTGSFLALYLAEAILLRRLVGAGPRAQGME